MFFIEGGSVIDTEDSKWIVYTVHKLVGDVESIVGFSSCYPYYHYHKTQQGQVRLRISQFLILPPYQNSSHGAKLYDTMWESFLSDSSVRQVAVEDPSDVFDDLRDKRDLARLERLGIFSSDSFKAPVSRAWINAQHAEQKMTPRQFQRCMEMALLKRLDSSNAEDLRNYRLQVKGRLYRHNKVRKRFQKKHFHKIMLLTNIYIYIYRNN